MVGAGRMFFGHHLCRLVVLSVKKITIKLQLKSNPPIRSTGGFWTKVGSQTDLSTCLFFLVSMRVTKQTHQFLFETHLHHLTWQENIGHIPLFIQTEMTD